MSKIDIVLDATMLDTFMMCQAKFNYRFNHNYVTPDKAKPLDRGTLIHVGMETYYKALKDGKDWHNAVDAMTTEVQVESSGNTSLEPSETKRVVDVLLETTERWRESDLRMEILAVEEPFIYLLHEDDSMRLSMMGKIDLLVNFEVYKELPVDHKSYDRDFPVHRKTNQFQNYAYATKSNYLLVNRIGFQTSIKPEIKHKRIPLCYDPLILEQWKQNVIRWARMYLDCALEDSWPLNDTSCDKFNRLCEYYQVCDASGNEAKVYKLTTLYNVGEPWDVSKSLGKREKK